MLHNGIEDWLGIVTIITLLSGWANYIVIRPLKDMIIGQNTMLTKIEVALEASQNDIQTLKERVAILEHDLKRAQNALDILEGIKK